MSEFTRKLESLINECSLEGSSNTPDFVLAGYLSDCLAAYNRAVQHRATWSGSKEVFFGTDTLENA